MRKRLRVAILTFYHNSNNYGGVLQAYALNKTIRQLGCECETLCYNLHATSHSWQETLINYFKVKGFNATAQRLCAGLLRKVSRICLKNQHRTVKIAQAPKKERFSFFREHKIPHSKTVYTKDTIADAVIDYDVFITGSDQVWNIKEEGIDATYFLDFVPPEKIKLSYAPGVSRNDLTEHEKTWLRSVLSNFDAISVREPNIVQLLQPVGKAIGKEIHWMPDPVLLLTAQEWEKIAAPRLIEKDYIFVYLLGESQKQRQIISAFAKAVALPIVFLPHVGGSYRVCDGKFGDIPRNDCGPEEFIRLISHAKFIFTDSFHGTVFSAVFCKEFFTFLRSREKDTCSMNNRLYSLAQQLPISDRIVQDDISVEQLLSFPALDREKMEASLAALRKKGRTFLSSSLHQAKPVEKEILEIGQTAKCTGCAACSSACPQKCIFMHPDKEGFLRPRVDVSTCVSCRLCEQNCPVLNKRDSDTIKQALPTFAAYNNDGFVRRMSSSGGIFSLLAKQVLSANGVVFGAVFDQNFNLLHKAVVNEQDLPQLYGSKYLQSEIGSAYLDAQNYLLQEKQVLFSGTPCQIAGLKLFLGKEYPNLITMDFICHGVPSPKVWRQYLSFRETEAQAPAVQVSFRDKRFGWKDFSMHIAFSNGKQYAQKVRKDPYMRGFLSNLFLRPCCHSCLFKGINRDCDITLADLWGVQRFLPDMDDNCGLSWVIPHSQKGLALLQALKEKACFQEIQWEQALLYNPSVIDSAPPNRLRQKFFTQIEEQSLPLFVRKHFRNKYMKMQIKSFLKKTACLFRPDKTG